MKQIEDVLDCIRKESRQVLCLRVRPWGESFLVDYDPRMFVRRYYRPVSGDELAVAGNRLTDISKLSRVLYNMYYNEGTIMIRLSGEECERIIE